MPLVALTTGVGDLHDHAVSLLLPILRLGLAAFDMDQWQSVPMIF